MLPEPSLRGLHHHSAADWRCILDARPDLAVRWIRFAAERGFRSAQFVLGQMHLDGHGVARDPGAAYAWFARSAAIGSLDARNMLGRCHELGWGVPVDHAEALLHYRRAAARGYGWALYNVGCLLLYGTVPRSHAEAFRCFTAASRTDQPEARAKALGLLGRCHEEGWGTAVALAAAERCYAAASEAGDCWGALNLGLLCAERGELAAAIPQLDRAVRSATPNCLAAIVRLLSRRAEPAFAELLALATARSTHLPPPQTCPAHVDRPPEGSVDRAPTGTARAVNAALVLAVLRRRLAARTRRALKLLRHRHGHPVRVEA